MWQIISNKYSQEQKTFLLYNYILGTMYKVGTLKVGDFQTPPPLDAFKQKNDVMKIIDVRFCLDPLPPT